MSVVTALLAKVSVAVTVTVVPALMPEQENVTYELEPVVTAGEVTDAHEPEAGANATFADEPADRATLPVL